MSNYRSSSPGRRAIYNSNYGRLSDINSSASRDQYPSPRSSADRVIPVSTQTYVRDGRTSDRLGDRIYETQPRVRRSTLNDSTRPSHLAAGSAANIPPALRSGPIVSTGRAASPPGRSSKDALESHGKSVKKVYAIGDTKTQLVDHIDLTPKRPRVRQESLDRGSSSQHYSRDSRASIDRTGHTVGGSSRSSKDYYSTAPQFTYTDAAGMFNETEPTWRRRQGSADRERPVSMMVESAPRLSQRDPLLGPPPSRGIERYNQGVLRSNSTRQHHRTGSRSAYDEPGYISQNEYDRRTARRADTIPPADYDHVRHPAAHSTPSLYERRPETADPYLMSSPIGAREAYKASQHDDRLAQDYRHEERREPRAYERHTQPRYKDASVERRGFGIRPASPDRQAQRSGADSLDRRGVYDDRAPSQPLDPRDHHRPDGRSDHADQKLYYAAESERKERYRDDLRDEARKRDREAYRSSRDDYDTRDERHHHSGDVTDKHRDHDKDYDNKSRDPREPREAELRERERERERDKRHDSTRLENDGPESKLSSVLPAAIAAGGLGAAAALGSEKVASRRKEKERDSSSSDEQRDRERDRDRDRDRDRERARDHDQDRDARRLRDHEHPRDTPPQESRRVHELPRDSPPQESRRAHGTNDSDMPPKPVERTTTAAPPTTKHNDADEEYRRRLQQAQQETYRARAEPPSAPSQPLQDSHRDQDHHRRERDDRPNDRYREDDQTFSRAPRRSSPDTEDRGGAPASGAHRAVSSDSSDDVRDTGDKRQSRVRIVEPPSEGSNKPKGILKKPKEQFPEDPNPVREGVAPLKDAKKPSKDIPANAKWTKVSRKWVNPEALEAAGERFEERDGFVIILRVLDQAQIQKLADKTSIIRERRQRSDERESRRQARRDADEYSGSSSEDDDDHSGRRRSARMLEGPPANLASAANFSGPIPSAGAPVPPPSQHSGMPGPPPGQYPPAPQGHSSHYADDYGRESGRDRDRRDRDRDRERGDRDIRDRDRD